MATQTGSHPRAGPPASVTIGRRTLALIAAAVAVVIASAITITLVLSGGSSSKPAPASAAGGKGGACGWSAYALPTKLVKQPPATVPTSGTVSISVSTSRGALTFTLDRAKAPCTVASFVSLAQQGYFDDSPCHRVTTAGIWIVQCGDPSGSGSGNPGYFIPDEATGSETYPAGTIAMARTPAPKSGGSQFFIVYKDSPALARHLGTLQYTVFGTVSRGLDVMRKVGSAGAQTGTDGRPKLSLQLLKLSAG